MRLSMSERRVLVKAFAARYRRGGKKARSEVLDEFVGVSGYCRAYASFLLRWHGKKVWVGRRLIVVGDAAKGIRRPRSRLYGASVEPVLRRVWELLDFVCGKR